MEPEIASPICMFYDSTLKMTNCSLYSKIKVFCVQYQILFQIVLISVTSSYLSLSD